MVAGQTDIQTHMGEGRGEEWALLLFLNRAVLHFPCVEDLAPSGSMGNVGQGPDTKEVWDAHFLVSRSLVWPPSRLPL